MSKPDQQHEEIAGDVVTDDGVIKRADGFFGVVGMAETTYYATEEIAARVARTFRESAKSSGSAE